jgi:hypothetical protein
MDVHPRPLMYTVQGLGAARDSTDVCQCPKVPYPRCNNVAAIQRARAFLAMWPGDQSKSRHGNRGGWSPQSGPSGASS